MKNLNKNHLLLLLFLVVYGILNYVWAKLDTIPPDWDQFRHLLISLKYQDILSTPDNSLFARLASAEGYYPPLFHLVAVFVYSIFGRSYELAVMTNMIFIAILVYSTYGIAARIYDNKTALMSAILVAGYPIIYGFARWFFTDIALAALTTLGVYLLLKTENFKSLRWSILFGLAAGSGMLVKWTYFVFIAGPFAWVIWKAGFIEITGREKHLRRAGAWSSIISWLRETRIYLNLNFDKMLNILVALLLGMAVMWTWYGRNFRYLIGEASKNQFDRFDPGIFSVSGFAYYLTDLNENHIFLSFYLLFLIGLAFMIFKKGMRRPVLPLWIAGGYLVHTLILQNKDPRYMMPILGAVAIISVQWLFALNKKWVRNVLLIAVAVVGLGQYWINFTGWGWLPNEVRVPLPFKIYPPEGHRKNSLRIYAQNFYSTHPPRQEDWQIETILAKILGTKPPDKAKIILFMRRNDRRFAAGMFQYVILRDRLPMVFTRKVEDSDYFVDRVGKGKPIPAETKGGNHRFLWDMPLPDGSRAVVYRSQSFSEPDTSAK